MRAYARVRTRHAAEEAALSPVDTLVDLVVGPVANGGWCVARYHGPEDEAGSGRAGGGTGRVVFVRHALPGERVRARVTEETRRFLRADAVEILEPSPDRVEPPCPYAGPGRCGGCDWQHATPDAQRRLKAAVVEEQLRRLAGVERAVTVEEVPAAPDGLGWRTRVQFAVRPDGVVGLRRHRSHEIEPIDACLIAHPQVEALGVEGRRWPGAAVVEAIVSAGTGDRAVLVTPRGGRQVRVPPLGAPAAVLRGDGRGGAEPVRGRPGVRETAAGRQWRVGGSGFWQVHPGAADLLTESVLAAVEPRQGDTALDLYCGVGLFAGALAAAVGTEGLVIGVEADQQAVRDARHNLRDLPQVRVLRGRVDAVLDRLAAGGEPEGAGRVALRHADLVVLDPPRAGAGREVVARIAALEPRRVAYVSCDPATLARDIGYAREHGLELTGLRAFDAFPMTSHVECLAVLDPVRRAG